MDDISKIHEKIKKLLKLKEGAEQIGSMEEALNASAKISDLLLKYNLDLNNINTKDKTVSDINLVSHILDSSVGYNKTEGTWMIYLYNTVCKYNMCRLIVGKTEKAIKLNIIGADHNIELVLFIASQLLHTIKNLRVISAKERISQRLISNKKAYYRSYSSAFVQAINERLYDQRQEGITKYEGTTALMVVNEKALQDKVNEEFRSIKPMNARNLKDNVGRKDGRRDGESTNINAGING